VLAEAFDKLYIDELFNGVESTRLVVEALTIRDNPLDDPKPSLFGDGRPFSFPDPSLSREMPMCFGFEKSFIFDFSPFCFCSRSGSCSNEMDETATFGLRGKATLAAVVAACTWPPTTPF
jgi:hypothetical protein